MPYRQQNLFKGAPKQKPIRDDGHDEHWHQSRFISWVRDSARLQTDPVKKAALEWLHSIPNGSYVHRATSEFKKQFTKDGVRKAPISALKLVAEGLTRGIWDLRLDYVVRDREQVVCPGLIIEMKRPGNTLSKEQKAYRDYMLSQGFAAEECLSWQEAAYAVIRYMSLDKHMPIFEWR